MNTKRLSSQNNYFKKAEFTTLAVSIDFSSPFKALFITFLFLFILFTLLPQDSLGSQSENQATFSLKGQVKLIDGGRIKRKVRVPSFETVEAPVGKTAGSLDKGIRGRNIYEGTGEIGNLKQIYMRDSTTYTEIHPVVFLQELKDKGRTWSAESIKESFLIENLPAGEYQITISVPGHTPVIQKISLDPADARDNQFKFFYSFNKADPEESRLLKAHYNPKSIPDGARSSYNSGVKAIDEGQVDQALVFLTKAVSRADYFTEAYERIGLIYFSQGKNSEAEDAFRKALNIDLYSYRSLSNLGTILLNKGEVDQAQTYYELAVKVRPQDPQARYNLAVTQFQLGNLEAAYDQLVKQKSLDQSHFTQPQLLSAEICRRNEDYDSMILELEEFLELFSDDPKAEQVRMAVADARKIKAESEQK